MSNEELLNEICCGSSNDFDEFSLELVNDILNQDTKFFNTHNRAMNIDDEYMSSSSVHEIDDSQFDKSIEILSPTESCSSILICKVCGAPAHGYNFDQITCESCKAFFRRNALRNMCNIKCRYNGNCVINMNNRRQCTYCRLKKCFDVKMRKDWIRTEEERQIRSLKKLHNQGKNCSPLSSDQLKSIRNISLVVRRKKRIKPLILKQANQQLVPKIEPICRLQTFAIHRNLFDKDRVLLNNIVNAYKIGADQADCSHMNRYTSTATFTQFLNDETIMYESLIMFFKHIPEFKQHGLTDQIALIKFNALDLIHLHHILVQDFHMPLQIGPHMSRWISANFNEQILEARYKYNRFMKYPILLKIVLVVFVFTIYLTGSCSSNHFMDRKNKTQVVDSQNFYAELLWRYLNYLFDEYEAIRAMQFIVTQILRFQLLMNIVDEVIQEGPHSSEFNPLMKSILRLN